MHDFLISLENTGVSIFIRESSSFLGFPTILTAHAFGYCFILASNALVSGRLLGYATTTGALGHGHLGPRRDICISEPGGMPCDCYP